MQQSETLQEGNFGSLGSERPHEFIAEAKLGVFAMLPQDLIGAILSTPTLAAGDVKNAALVCTHWHVDGRTELRAIAGAVVRDCGGGKELCSAAYFGNEMVVLALVEAGADVNATDRNGSTPLSLAAQNSFVPIKARMRIIRSLLDVGAVVNKDNLYGLAPLHFASQRGLLAVVRILVDAGAQTNSPTKDGRTPYCLAAQRRDNEDVLRLLVAYGAEVDNAGGS